MKSFLCGILISISSSAIAENFRYECLAEMDLFNSERLEFDLNFRADILFRQNDFLIYDDSKITVRDNSGILLKDEPVKILVKEGNDFARGRVQNTDKGLFILFYRETFTVNFDIQVLFFYAPGRGKFTPEFLCSNLDF